MKKSQAFYACNHLTLSVLILGFILFFNPKVISQQLPVTEIRIVPERVPVPSEYCIPECRNEVRVDFDTIPQGGDSLIFMKDELIISFHIDSLNCKRLSDLSLNQRQYQEAFYKILINYGISISNISNTSSAILSSCSDNALMSELKKFYVQSILDEIQPIGEDPRQLPIESNIKSCLCDKNLFLYEDDGVHSQGFVQAAQEDDRIEPEGGSISRNLIIEATKNTLTIRKNDIITTGELATTPPNTKVIAILDSGIHLDFFKSKLYHNDIGDLCLGDDTYGWNFIDDNGNTEDFFGHGTLVAASLDFTIYSSDSANKVFRILPVKVLDDCGYGTLYSVTCGLYYAKAKQVDIVNTSWGLYHHRTQLQEAVKEVVNADIDIVASAGNDSENFDVTDHFPSGYSFYSPTSGVNCFNDEKIHAVSGLNQSYNVTSRCNMNKWEYSNFDSTDINIVENAIGYHHLLNSNTNYSSLFSSQVINCRCEGTSYAAPKYSAALIIDSQFDIRNSSFQVKNTQDYILHSYWTNKFCQYIPAD